MAEEVEEQRAVVGEGREAEILAWGERRVLRLMRDLPGAELRLQREAAALAAAADAGAPAPAVHERVTLDGRAGLVLERVDGPDLVSLLGRRPWLILDAARTLGRLQAELHRVAAPASLPTLAESIVGKIDGSDLVPPRLGELAKRLLDDLPDGDRLCHGDFHPANVLCGTRGPVAIDWHAATRGDPIGDLARTQLILGARYVPPNSPWLVRRFHGVGRSVLADGALRAYRRVAPFDAELMRRWQLVRAVDRLSEGIEIERGWLLNLIESRKARQIA